jgi:hypothetical protein
MVGAVAQLGEHLLCKQGVSGSIPLSSTNLNLVSRRASGRQYPLKKNVFARRFLSVLCLFCLYCEEKIDLEASRCGIYPASEPFPGDIMDGLAGRI